MPTHQQARQEAGWIIQGQIGKPRRKTAAQIRKGIIAGAVTSGEEPARRFLAAVASSTRMQHPGVQRSASAAGPTAPPPAAPAASGAKSFPLADQQPGQEPK